MRLSALYAVVSFIAFASINLYADHTHPQGSVAALAAETDELYREVSYAPLNSSVKNAVYRFVRDVRSLDYCADHCRDHTTIGVPASCYSYYSRANSSFYPVDRYLYDTYYDLPRVYQAYVSVKNALYSLHRDDEINVESKSE